MVSAVIPAEAGIQDRDGVGEISILTSVVSVFVSSVNDGV